MTPNRLVSLTLAITFSLTILPAHARSPATRFVESTCAATLAATAADAKLTGSAARSWIKRLPASFDQKMFSKAQASTKIYVQTSVVTGDEAVARLNHLVDETYRLNALIAETRGQRQRARWSNSAYLALATLSAVGAGAGLVSGPEAWSGGAAAVAGFASTAYWLEKLGFKRRYPGAPRGRYAGETSAIWDLADQAQRARAAHANGGPPTEVNATLEFEAILSSDLIAEARIDGRVPIDMLVDAVDQNVVWDKDPGSVFRPAMEVATTLILTGNSTSGPTLTTVVYFLPFQPQRP